MRIFPQRGGPHCRNQDMQGIPMCSKAPNTLWQSSMLYGGTQCFMAELIQKLPLQTHAAIQYTRGQRSCRGLGQNDCTDRYTVHHSLHFVVSGATSAITVNSIRPNYNECQIQKTGDRGEQCVRRILTPNAQKSRDPHLGRFSNRSSDLCCQSFSGLLYLQSTRNVFHTQDHVTH
jgi:hypothetical protein